MKLAARAVESFLQTPEAQSRAVLIYGVDGGLVRERANRIKRKILGESDDPFAFVEMDEARLLSDPAIFADELSAISLMGGKRLIWLRGAGDKSAKIIEAAAPLFHAGVYVIVTADELPARSMLRALFESKPDMAALACYKDEARDVQEVVRKAFEEAGVRADRDVVQYLASQLGNDRYVTRQELEKIITYAGDQKSVSLADAQALVDYSRDTGMDDLCAAAADRNLAQLDAVLARLARDGAQPVAFLRALQRYFNRLYSLRSKVNAGLPADQAVASARPPVFFKQVPVMTRHLNNWDIPQLAKALKLLVEAELACKTTDLPALPAASRKLMAVTQVR